MNIPPKLGGLDPAPTVYGRAEALPFRSGTFDTVTFYNFPANAVTSEMFTEAARVLRPGGFTKFTSGSDLDIEQTVRYMQGAGFTTDVYPGKDPFGPTILGGLG